MGSVLLGDYNFEKTEYQPWVSYSQSKTANIWMANEITRRYGPSGLQAYVLHPGGINSGLGKHVDPEFLKAFDNDPTAIAYYKSPEQGAATQVLAAVSREWEGKPPKWLSNCEEWGPFGQVEAKKVAGLLAMGDDGYVPHAFDQAGAKQLWADSCKFVGVENDA